MTLKLRDTQPSAVVAPAEVEEEFYYGHRIVATRDEMGREIYTYQLRAEEAERRMRAMEAELARVREELARARQGVED